jgi:RNA polymerase sigma factor (sigma-70 family)
LDDKYYIKRVLAGDKNSFRHLVDKYQNMAYTVAYRILRHHENSEEAVQEAFLKAYQSLSNFRLGAKFSTWLYRITFNSAIDIKRKMRTNISSLDDDRQPISEGTENLTTEIDYAFDDENKFIKNAINKLPEIDSLLITLYHLHELKINEITKITGLKSSNIKTRLMRSRREMRRYLERNLKTEIEELR